MVQLFNGMPCSCLKNKTKKQNEEDLCVLIWKAIQSFILRKKNLMDEAVYILGYMLYKSGGEKRN